MRALGASRIDHILVANALPSRDATANYPQDATEAKWGEEREAETVAGGDLTTVECGGARVLVEFDGEEVSKR